MKLRDACDIAVACGLETTGEAVLNIQMHCTQIFAYDDITEELRELTVEYKGVGDQPIRSVFPDCYEEGGDDDANRPTETAEA